MDKNEFPKFYKKAIKGGVGGRVLNNKGDVTEFLLRGDPEKVDVDEITLEISNQDMLKHFLKANKAAIVRGYLIEVSDHEFILDEVNAVTDGQLKDMLKLSLSKMKPKVEKFTSPVPVQRLLDFAKSENKPVKTIEYLEGILKRFNVSTKLPEKIVK
jgi:hypothetical protein